MSDGAYEKVSSLNDVTELQKLVSSATGVSHRTVLRVTVEKKTEISEILGFHSGENTECSLLGCATTWYCR
jgi:hypothetical protein